jgi:putative DNA methylase
MTSNQPNVGPTAAEAVQLALPLDREAPRASQGRRSIEIDFPILEVSQLAQLESYRKNIYRPAYYIHKWWARRTGATFRAILLGALLPEGHSPLEFFYQANAFQDAIILDPFMGGGTTIGEALRLGARAIGVDVNPVSWFLVKKIVEPVSLRALDWAYRTLEQIVGQEILRLYETTCPQCQGMAQAVYTYWVKVVPCRTCGQAVPLRKTMVLARHMSKAHTGLVACSECGHPYVSSTLDRPQRCPACEATFDPHQGFSKRASYTCPACGGRDQILEALRNREDPPQHSMIAIHYLCPTCGKGYKRPDAQDLAAYKQIKERFQKHRDSLLYPRTPVRPGYNTNQMINYHYHYWSQMFNERQLLGLSMLLEAILQIEDRNVMELMLLLFSGALEFNNMFCSPKGLGTGAVRHLFAHHAFIPAKEPLETHLWGVNRSSGGFSTLYRDRLRRGKAYAKRPVERRIGEWGPVKVPIPGERVESVLASSFEELTKSPDRRVFLLNRSSTDLSEIPAQSVDAVITDPPYMDNVMYSELSDFFYVWLQLALKERYPQFACSSVSREDEAIVNPDHGKGIDYYRATLAAVFQECHRLLKDEGLLSFTFHHGAAEAWDAVAETLREASFVIRRIWPVHAEMDVGVPILGKHSVKFDAILVCRKRGGVPAEPIEDREELVGCIKAVTQSMLERLEGAFSLSEADRASLFQAAAAMLYTQGRTNLLPSSIIVC